MGNCTQSCADGASRDVVEDADLDDAIKPSTQSNNNDVELKYDELKKTITNFSSDRVLFSPLLEDDSGTVELASTMSKSAKRLRLLQVIYGDIEKLGPETRKIMEFDPNGTKTDEDKEKFMKSLPLNSKTILQQLQFRIDRNPEVLQETKDKLDRIMENEAVLNKTFLKKKIEKAAAYAYLVATLSTQQGREKPAIEALRYQKAGFFFTELGKYHKEKKYYTKAKLFYNKALTIYKMKGGAQTMDAAQAGLLLAVATGCKDEGADFATAKSFIDSATAFRKSIDKNDPNRTYLVSACSLAKSQLEFAKKQYSNAHQPCDEAKKAREEKKVNPLLIAQCHYLRATIFNTIKDYAKAITCAQNALNCIEQYDDYEPTVEPEEYSKVQTEHCDITEFFWRNLRYWKIFIQPNLNSLIEHAQARKA